MKTPFKSAIIVLFLSSLCGGKVWAQSAEAYNLKHRSSFSNPTAHNPFWPIGWVKGVENTRSSEEPAALITADSFVVSGISLSPTPMALINNKACAEGETIEAKYGAQTLKIKVIRINDGSVTLEYQNKNYTVPLKHPKLSSDSAPKELPPEDHQMLLH